MALFRFEASIVSRDPPRGKPRNAIQDAAYIARECLKDDRTGRNFDYSTRDGLEWSGIFTPKDAPKWMHDRQTLWSEVEAREDLSTRPDHAQLARKFIIALPHELNEEQRRWLVTDFARELSRKGMVVDVAIHRPDEHSDDRNYHAHVMTTMREVTSEGFGQKVREWNKKDQLEQWRERFAALGARSLARAGFEEEAERYRVGFKTNREQAEEALKRGDHEHAEYLKDKQPNIHLGPNVAAMERKEKHGTEKAKVYHIIKERNESKSPVVRDIREAYESSRTASQFHEKIEKSGRYLARLSEHEADIYRAEPGEYVVMSTRGTVYRLNERSTGDDRAEVKKFLSGLDNRKTILGVDETRTAIASRWLSKANGIELGIKKPGLPSAIISTPVSVVGKALDVAVSLFEGRPLSPEEQDRGESARRQREIEAEEEQRRRQREAYGRDR